MSVPSQADLDHAIGVLVAGHRTNDDTTVDRCLGVLAAATQPFYDGSRRRWLVTRYRHAHSLLRDPTLSNDLTQARTRTRSSALARRLLPSAPSILFTDPPKHTILRRVFAGHFNPAASRHRGAPLKQRYRKGLSRAVTKRPFTLGSDLVHPICLAEALHAMGLPSVDDVPQMIEDLYAINTLFDFTRSEAELAMARAASERVRGYLARALPRTALARSLRDAGFGEDTMLSSVEFILRASVVTAGSLLMSAITDLLLVPRPVSVEDLLIANTPAADTGRITLTDTLIAGVTIRAGSTIAVHIAAANHDLITTPGARREGHLVFGAGRHRCLGAPLVHAHVHALQAALSHSHLPPVDLAVAHHRTPTFRGLRDCELVDRS